jgi:predicted GIY-YIG superfamily endonuclease
MHTFPADFTMEKTSVRFFAYILRSQRDGSNYYGSTSNVEGRLQGHNEGIPPTRRNIVPMLFILLKNLDQNPKRAEESYFTNQSMAIAG